MQRSGTFPDAFFVARRSRTANLPNPEKSLVLVNSRGTLAMMGISRQTRRPFGFNGTPSGRGERG